MLHSIQKWIFCGLLLALAACQGQATPQTFRVTVAPTEILNAAPVYTETPTFTPTLTTTPTPSLTPTPTLTLTTTPSLTPTLTLTMTPSLTPTLTPSLTPTQPLFTLTPPASADAPAAYF
ncbi:MAG: hypothetical protein K8L99_34785, partial [Anaerolineae bacterium]|nr:hypothetical protein [Anaerolineae bacterium]